MRTSPWVPRLILGVAAAAVLAVMISIAVGRGGSQPIQITGGDEMRQLVGGIQQDGPFLGSPDAPLTITVFNDLQAPSGASYELNVVDPLIEQYARTGQGRLQMRHFSFGAADTNRAAYAAVAAAQQDREWQYAELFFRNQDQAPGGMVTDEFLRDVANADAELNADEWQRALDSGRVGKQVQADAQAAIDLRLPAAPAVVVSGPGGSRQLDDAPSLDEVKAAIAAVE